MTVRELSGWQLLRASLRSFYSPSGARLPDPTFDRIRERTQLLVVGELAAAR